MQNILILLHRGGQLEKEFASIYPCVILKKKEYGYRKNIFLRITDYLYYLYKIYTLKYKIRNYNYIISNTLANGRLLKKISSQNIPIFTYVHELESVIKILNKNKDAYLSLKYSQKLIYPSEIVKKYLIAKNINNENKLNQLKYCFSISQTIDANLKKFERKKISLKYNIDTDALWIVGYGTCNKRKGIDLFVEIAKLVSIQNQKTIFFWIGDFDDKEFELLISSKIIEYDVLDKCIMIPSMPWNIYNLLPFDLFALTSREDPYPLVVIEAGFNHIPAVVFKDGGGITDFVKHDAGWMIDDFSNIEFANTIHNLSLDKDLILEKGINAHKKAVDWHFNEENTLLSFKSIVESA